MDALNSLEERIKILIVSYLTNEISSDDLDELHRWMNRSPENKELFNRFKTSWMAAGIPHFDSGQSFADLKSAMDEQRNNTLKTHHKLNRMPAILKYAAIALLFLTAGGVLSWLIKPEYTSYGKVNTVISAPLGAKSVVILPDGTKVWLNAGSKIEYGNRYGKNDRIVFLSGEAFFDVAKDKSKPFLVKTSLLSVKALGTKFNVKAYPEEKTITATLEEGKIEIETKLEQTGKTQMIYLKPNEKVVYYKPNSKSEKQSNKKSLVKSIVPANIEVTENVNTSIYTSWKDNRWILKGESLGTLGILMERRFNITMIFQKPELMNYKFSGIIENETLEQILDVFKYTAPIDYKVNKDTVFIYLNNTQKERYEKLTTF